MVKRIFLLMIVFLPWLFFCESLERDNVLDPKNRNSSVEQLVLVELFVNDSTGSEYCSHALEAIEAICRQNGYADKVLALEYHMALNNDTYGLPACTDRYHEYVPDQNKRGIPDAFFNGAAHRVQGASAENIKSRYLSVLDSLLGKKSSFRMEASKTINNNSLEIRLRLARLGSSEQENFVVQTVIYEDLGSNQHRYLVRKILNGYLINSINPGEVKDIILTASLDNISNPDQMFVLIFLQDQTTNAREIFQTIKF